jgi:hypothetical protein
LKTIEAEATTPATRDEVWSLLEDAASWADWGSWSSVEVDGGGPQGRDSCKRLARAASTRHSGDS